MARARQGTDWRDLRARIDRLPMGWQLRCHDALQWLSDHGWPAKAHWIGDLHPDGLRLLACILDVIERDPFVRAYQRRERVAATELAA